ncbi:hypothetical protein [Streptomyces shenzhenensis]|uniref:hypothetical protein n=1 Tax=Streptomyces shenzhenensis TaxID=943815 RepID=UPI001F3DDBF9|nr:hypothetical protein [Streptomyces shenzhenensis]
MPTSPWIPDRILPDATDNHLLAVRGRPGAGAGVRAVRSGPAVVVQQRRDELPPVVRVIAEPEAQTVLGVREFQAGVPGPGARGVLDGRRDLRRGHRVRPGTASTARPARRRSASGAGAARQAYRRVCPHENGMHGA